MKRSLCSVLCAAILLTLLPTAFAANIYGLAAFTESKQYSDSTFVDVPDDAWYSPSVKTVYEKAIMDGTGGGKFDPNSTISWSQAVTIAARLHAVYHNSVIRTAEGAWYIQYLDYAKDNELLPAICPDNDLVDTSPITREGLAVLFRSVLDEKDLPVINDRSIPDLDKVREEYRDAVSGMFASGIFTGKDGLFDPDGKATRAEVATIVARLLCPGQRVSQDSKQNPYMADQMGNLYNGGLCARSGDTVYYIYSESAMEGKDEYSFRHAIFSRTDSGQVRQVYRADGGDDSLDLLSVGPDGMLYFTQRTYQSFDDQWTVLKQLDPKTGAVKDIYTTARKTRIDFYLFYDNELYLYEGFTGGRIGRVTGGKLTPLATIPDWENLYVADTMYCFGGKLYWLQLAPRDSNGDDRLMILDLETKKTSSVVTEADHYAYQGATLWSAELTNGDYPVVLKRRSLAMPELTETVRVMDEEFAHYAYDLYANGPQLYYQGRNAQKLCTVSPSGALAVVATARTPYFEASAVTSQGIALMWHDGAAGNMNGTSTNVDFILPDGQRTRLSAVLNQPYFLPGKDQLTAAEDQAVWEPEEDGTDTDISSDVLKAYTTAGGDVALEVKVTNRQSGPCRVGYVTLRLSGTAKGEACFYVTTYLDGKQSETFTFVFPKGAVEVTGSMEGLEADVITAYQDA